LNLFRIYALVATVLPTISPVVAMVLPLVNVSKIGSSFRKGLNLIGSSALPALNGDVMGGSD